MTYRPGANGSGKSTLIRLVSTLLVPDEGAIRVFGFDPRSKRDVQEFVPQPRDEHQATVLLTTHDMAEADWRCYRCCSPSAARR